ncbi:MAG: ABC transporter permease [Chloroflexota bacterium]|nr:carbohydrate ABC transporter permease [Caldilinea sp.]GIK75703.1 MAG: ABC transporter permease [Chloroflexota bacterium]
MAVTTTYRSRTIKTKRLLSAAGIYALVLLAMTPTLFIFFWMVSLSLKVQVENTAYPPVFIPSQPTLNNYRLLGNQFVEYVFNSVIIATGATVLGMVLGAPASFGMVRWRYQRLALVVLVARIIPAISFLVPWFILFRRMGLLDTYTALILSHLVVGLPIIIWMLLAFFEDVPMELQDAALIDGCSIYGVFWRVALPLTRPGLAATAILSFIFSWNNFLFSVILAGRTTRPLPVAVFSLLTYEEINWGPLAGAAFLITLPVLIITLFMQRHIVTGLSFGAVKG